MAKRARADSGRSFVPGTVPGTESPPFPFGGEPPPIRITTRRDCVFIGFDRKSFEAFMEEQPRLAILFLREVIRVLFVRSRAMAERLTDVF